MNSSNRNHYTLLPMTENAVLLAVQKGIAPAKKRSLKKGWAAFIVCDDGTGGEGADGGGAVNDPVEIAAMLEERGAEFSSYVETETVAIHTQEHGAATILSCKVKDKSLGAGRKIHLQPIVTVTEDDGLDDLLGINQKVRRNVVPSAPTQPKRVVGDRVQLWKGGPWFPVNPEVLKRDAAKAREAFAFVRC